MAKQSTPKTMTSVEETGKDKALGMALDTIEKQFGKGSIMKLGEPTE